MLPDLNPDALVGSLREMQSAVSPPTKSKIRGWLSVKPQFVLLYNFTRIVNYQF